MNHVNPMGEVACDGPCEKAQPCRLREFQMGSRACECGGRYLWYAADRDDEYDRDEWERR